MDVPTIGSSNRAQTSDEISSNPHNLVGRIAEEGMFDRFPQKLDKRFNIERLKAFEAMTIARTTNPTNMEK